MFKYIMALLALTLVPSMASATTFVQAPKTDFSFSKSEGLSTVSGKFSVDAVNANGIYTLADLTKASVSTTYFIFNTGNYGLKDLTSFSAYVVKGNVEALSLLTKDCFEFSFGKIPTVTVPPVTAAVPEPATWAMMIVGFALVGYAMRARSKSGQFRPALV